MTSSKFATDGAPTSELPPLQRQENGHGVEGENEDEEGFQTVVSKRTAKLLQQQQAYQNRYNSRKGYYGGGHGYGYGNGNGRHYHRQYGPPHHHNGSSTGTNSNSSASSIPEELPKEKEVVAQDPQHQNQADSSTSPRSQLHPTAIPNSPPSIAWARIAAGDAKPPKPDVPQSLGIAPNTCHSPVSSCSFDVKPLAISLVTSACDGIQDETPVKPSSANMNSVAPVLPKQPQAQQQDQSQSAVSATPTRPQPQIIIPPPPPSVWGRRMVSLPSGKTNPDVAQTKTTGSTSSVLAGTSKAKLQSTGDWPSLDEAVKPQIRQLEVKAVSFTSQNDGTTPSESATDSGNEEILRITGLPELSDEKWPLPLVSNGVGKAQGKPEEALLEKLRQSRHSSGDAMSSSGCDHGGQGEGQEEDPGTTEIKKKKKNKKTSKPKWVPLILEDEPPKPPAKPKKKKNERYERGTGNQQQQHKNGDSYGGGNNGADASSESATPTEGLPRKASGPGRGGRNGKQTKHRNYHNYYKFYKETSDLSEITDLNGEMQDYTDYPPEFTTINSMFPMTEFVMPYANYGTYSPPPDAQSYSFVPLEEPALSQRIQAQIEYYFSEENLERDFYLRRKMDSEGYIPISLICGFYRIQSMTQDYNVVLNAIKASELIEVKEEEETCASARPVVTPTKWPIVDIAASSIPPPPTLGKSFLTNVLTPSSTTTSTETE